MPNHELYPLIGGIAGLGLYLLIEGLGWLANSWLDRRLRKRRELLGYATLQAELATLLDLALKDMQEDKEPEPPDSERKALSQ